MPIHSMLLWLIQVRVYPLPRDPPRLILLLQTREFVIHSVHLAAGTSLKTSANTTLGHLLPCALRVLTSRFRLAQNAHRLYWRDVTHGWDWILTWTSSISDIDSPSLLSGPLLYLWSAGITLQHSNGLIWIIITYFYKWKCSTCVIFCIFYFLWCVRRLSWMLTYM